MKPSRCKPNPACSPFVRGFPGKKGDPGPPGNPGPGGGDPGPPGRGILNAQVNEDGELIITYTDNTTQNLGVITGPAGPPGGGPGPDPDPDPDPDWPAFIRIGFTADHGVTTQAKIDLIEEITQLNLEKVILGGDNSYGGDALFDADWLPWNPLITEEKIIPVLGNHDLDGAMLYNLHYNKFPYLPGNRRYYNIVLGSGLVELFILNTGVNTAFQSPVVSGAEPHDNVVGGAQHTWFVNALNASTAKWKLVFFHHPFVTTSKLSNRIVPAMNWPEFSKVDAIFNGHVHFTEWLTYRGLPIINVSGAVKQDGDTGLDITGPSEANLLWADDKQRLFAKITATPRDVIVELVSTTTGQVVYQRSISDKTFHHGVWTVQVVSPMDVVSAQFYDIGMSPRAMIVQDWFVTSDVTGSQPLTGWIWVDGARVSFFQILPGEYWTRAIPTSGFALRIGAAVDIEIAENLSYPAWTGLTVSARGRSVG